MDQVGKGNIAVVSPPTTYDNMVHPEAMAAAGGDPHYAPPPDYSNGSEDNVFSDGAIRRGFIRKVYLILMVQLLVTVGIICAFLYWEHLRKWTFDNYWFTYAMMAVTLVLILAMTCCNNVRRIVPFNFIALGLAFIFIFPHCIYVFYISLCRFFNAEAVLWAVGATALVSFSLTVFAMQSKWDFTAASGSLWVFLWTLLSFAMLCAILRSISSLSVFSLQYLVLDTQLILGGHKKYEISPEEYVFAALNLYLDIVSLFIMLLHIISLCR
uniref:Zgc:110410 n=1 Tax=Labrus bergylta TaxID=56723 RepID=A0A3Q3EM22_9LABR